MIFLLYQWYGWFWKAKGQHRSLVLSIKLAEVRLITNESPILLLDDVMRELDNTRQLKLLETISQSIKPLLQQQV